MKNGTEEITRVNYEALVKTVIRHSLTTYVKLIKQGYFKDVLPDAKIELIINENKFLSKLLQRDVLK